MLAVTIIIKENASCKLLNTHFYRISNFDANFLNFFLTIQLTVLHFYSNFINKKKLRYHDEMNLSKTLHP